MLLSSFAVQDSLGAKKDRAEHRIGELACGRILLAGMEGADEYRLAGTRSVFLVMAEDEVRAARDFAQVAQDGQINVEGQASERDNDFQIVEQFQFFFQIRAAVAHLFRERLVAWGSAADGGADVCVGELKVVAPRDAGRLRGETGLEKSPIEEVAGAVAGEHAPGPIGAVRAGREADQEHAGAGIAEAGHWFGPIILVAVGATFYASDFLAVFNQARTSPASNNLAIQDLKGFQVQLYAT